MSPSCLPTKRGQGGRKYVLVRESVPGWVDKKFRVPKEEKGSGVLEKEKGV